MTALEARIISNQAISLEADDEKEEILQKIFVLIELDAKKGFVESLFTIFDDNIRQKVIEELVKLNYTVYSKTDQIRIGW